MDTDRRMAFSTVFNFRDLGGYPTTDGRTVRTGRLYRADGLFRLSGDDLSRFTALNLRRVIDLRRPDELDEHGRVPDSPGLAYHNVCLQVDPWTAAEVTADGMARYLADRYAEIADEGAGTGTMGRVLRMIADSSAGPTVFHCAAGKDRTGVVAALVLALLSVPDDTIAEDYAVSQAAERQYLVWRAENRPDLPSYKSPGNAAPVETMRCFLAELRDRYGSVTDYARRIGFDQEHHDELREHLLEGPRVTRWTTGVTR
ncbi:MAG: tyrosine-protein phosphatase [Actinocatenispora sp.]